MNPYPYSLDNKRYQTFNYYLKKTFHEKVAKVILDARFTCPNRDGSKAYGGCAFCSNKGSGDANLFSKEDLERQFIANKKIMLKKWDCRLFIPYFQNFSNTYGSIAKIRAMIEQFIAREEVVGIALATRSDCLDEEKIALLKELNKIKPIWLEIGIETTNDKTLDFLNRQETFADFKKIAEALKDAGLKICLHIINGLPFESEEVMLKTIKDLNDYQFDAIKIHMLYLIKDTKLAKIYEEKPFKLLTRDEYINTTIKQLELLRNDVIIERLSGDPIKSELIAPLWVLDKRRLLNDIDKRMQELDTWQGKYYER